MINNPITSARGMRDIFSPESNCYQELINKTQKILHQYGYQPLFLPLLEKTSLFARGVGEDTDIVGKEMYSFLDRNQESLTLRPEATAGVVRALIQNGMLQQVSRLYAFGEMFRYERPQKGRYRQFQQISVEAFGISDYFLDVELIQIAFDLFGQLNILDNVRLEINTIGLLSEREQFKKSLVNYLKKHENDLDKDSKNRLNSNPLRILDSKDEKTQQILVDAPVLVDYLSDKSIDFYQQFKKLLDLLQIKYYENHRLVRGLDYYCHSVFEWTTDQLGAQSTICAGGRYDGLVKTLGGVDTFAAGFAFGVDRIVLLAQQSLQKKQTKIMVVAGDLLSLEYLLVNLPILRKCLPDISFVLVTQIQSLKNQFKKADKAGADFVLLSGEKERNNQQFTIKNLSNGNQELFNLDQLINFLKKAGE